MRRRDGRAESTRQSQIHQLERFLRKTGLTEAALLKATGDRKRIERIADGFIDSEKKAGRRPAYALAVWFGVKSFLDSAGHPVAHNPSLTPAEMAPADIASRRVPTQAELRRLLDTLSLRNRAVVLMLATSGVRIGVLATGIESDGLRLESLPDLDLRSGEFKAKPPLLFIPARLSKNGRPYMTAISTEAAGVIETYLSQRLAAGEKLSPKTPLFVPDARGLGRAARTAEGFRTLNRNALCNAMSEALAKVAPPGIHWTAHTLRAWCSSRLESAESQGLISRTRREFFMGHALGVDGIYNLDRPLSEDAREELRASYAKVEAFLTTSVTKSDDQLQSVLRFVLMGAGVDEKVIDEMGVLSVESATEVIRKVGAGRKAEVVHPMRAGEQKLVPVGEADAWIATGEWEGRFMAGDRMMLQGVAWKPA
jgi:integrase